MKRRTGAALRGASISLWMASAVAVGISCRGDETAAPVEPGSASEDPALATRTATPTLRFIQISAGTDVFGAHSCGVTTTNRIYCWGSNSSGELGNGKTGFETRPVAVASRLRFRSVSAGFFHTCAVAMDRRAYCWGEGATGALGDGSTGAGEPATARRLRPVLVAGGLRFRHVEATHSHTCGLTVGHRIYCWGYNAEGQLGDGTTTKRLRPTPVAGRRRFRAMTASVGHGCGVTTEYRAFCWGYNVDGRLGDGTTRSTLTPVAVATRLTFRQISAGYGHTCAVSRNNRPFCWGTGAIGDGTELPRLRPTAVAGGLTLERVDAGVGHNCGNGYDGQGYCWGANLSGQLGKGTGFGDHFVASPSLVLGGLSFKQLSAGGIHSCGITTAGKAYCWGFNGAGQLGDGTLDGRLVPTAVAGPM